jgi:hypothetical protein
MACISVTPLAGVADACHEPSTRTPATAIPAPTATESLSVIVFSWRFLFALHRRFSIRLTDGKVRTLRLASNDGATTKPAPVTTSRPAAAAPTHFALRPRATHCPTRPSGHISQHSPHECGLRCEYDPVGAVSQFRRGVIQNLRMSIKYLTGSGQNRTCRAFDAQHVHNTAVAADCDACSCHGCPLLSGASGARRVIHMG